MFSEGKERDQWHEMSQVLDLCNEFNLTHLFPMHFIVESEYVRPHRNSSG